MLSHLATVKKKGFHWLVIYITLENPSVSSDECMTTDAQPNWMTPIKSFLENEDWGAQSEKTMRH